MMIDGNFFQVLMICFSIAKVFYKYRYFDVFPVLYDDQELSTEVLKAKISVLLDIYNSLGENYQKIIRDDYISLSDREKY